MTFGFPCVTIYSAERRNSFDRRGESTLQQHRIGNLTRFFRRVKFCMLRAPTLHDVRILTDQLDVTSVKYLGDDLEPCPVASLREQLESILCHSLEVVRGMSVGL
jgi:hypothetical protein